MQAYRIFRLFIFFVTILHWICIENNFAQTRTLSTFDINGEWVTRNQKKFFAKIAGYFYLESLPEYQEIEKQKGKYGAFIDISESFNVIMLPWWPRFLENNGYKKLAFENGNNPAFSIDYSNGYYKEIKSSDRVVLMTQTTYLMDLLRYAGLNDYKMSSGYFNHDNPIKTSKNNWVVGPKDMESLIKEENYCRFFGTEISWGYFQKNVVNVLMKDRGEFFWFLTDEPERNGLDWFLPQAFLKKIYQSLTNNNLNNICFVSFGPAKYGNTYLFSKEYPNRIPDNKKEAYSNDYFFSYGEDYDGLKKNVKLTINYYKDVGNVFGINDYSLINEDPAYAGYFVDWIREEKGEVPIWIWVAPYLYSTDYSLLKCQVFTAIVHGATGIGFWLMNKEGVSDPNQLFKAIKLSQEIELIQPILIAEIAVEIMGTEKWLKGKNEIHYTIKKMDSDELAIIAVNTSKMNSETFELSLDYPYNIDIKKILSPMEVEIIF